MTKCLLYYLLPWLYNMELVDPNVNLAEAAVGGEGRSTGNTTKHSSSTGGREGWGTAEATEMITNNLFYITVKVFNDSKCTLYNLLGG